MNKPVPGEERGRSSRFWHAVTGQGELSQKLSRDATMQLPWIGFRMFKWLVALVFLLLIAVVVYGILTYPSQDDLLKLAELDRSKKRAAQIVASARDQWQRSVIELGVQFVITPIVPLLGAIAGYIFGVSRQGGGRGRNGGDGQNGGGAEDEERPSHNRPRER